MAPNDVQALAEVLPDFISETVEESGYALSKTFPRRDRRTAGPSTALRSGRDDKGKGGYFRKVSDSDGQN
jgi:hypothetical protein